MSASRTRGGQVEGWTGYGSSTQMEYLQGRCFCVFDVHFSWVRMVLYLRQSTFPLHYYTTFVVCTEATLTSCKVVITPSISFTAATISLASAWRFEVKACRYFRQEFVITSAHRKSVVVIASWRLLASVSESDDYKPVPSSQILSTVDGWSV